MVVKKKDDGEERKKRKKATYYETQIPSIPILKCTSVTVMKIGTWVTLNKSSFRNNTGNWKAHMEIIGRGRTEKKTRKSWWMFLPAHKSVTQQNNSVLPQISPFLLKTNSQRESWSILFSTHRSCEWLYPPTAVFCEDTHL